MPTCGSDRVLHAGSNGVPYCLPSGLPAIGSARDLRDARWVLGLPCENSDGSDPYTPQCTAITRRLQDDRLAGGVQFEFAADVRWLGTAAQRWLVVDAVRRSLFNGGTCSIVGAGAPGQRPDLPLGPALLFMIRVQCREYWTDPTCTNGGKWEPTSGTCTLGEDPPTPPPPAPTATLTATPPTIDPGDSSTLEWTSANASSADLQPGIGSVATAGTHAVSPVQTTVYTLTVSNSGGDTATATATVQVRTAVPPPPITDCKGDPHPTQELADAVECLDCAGRPHPTEAAAAAIVCDCRGDPHDTPEEAARVVCGVDLTLSADPVSIPLGGSSDLRWNCTRCQSLLVDTAYRDVRTQATGTVKVSPPVTTTFTARATGVDLRGRDVTLDREATVTVTPPIFLDACGNPHPTQEAADAVSACSFSDCQGNTHATQAGADAVTACHADCRGNWHDLQADAAAVTCYADCAGRRIHATQAAAAAVSCYADCAGRRNFLTQAAAAAIHCDCRGNPHPTPAAAQAVQCLYTDCRGNTHPTQQAAQAVQCLSGNDCEPVPLVDGYNGNPPTGLGPPPHCDAPDAWEVWTEEEPVLDGNGNQVLDGNGDPVTQTVEHRRQLPCEHWLSPEKQAFESQCLPCETAAYIGPIPGTGEYGFGLSLGDTSIRGSTVVHRTGRSFSARTSEEALAQTYCHMEGAYKGNLNIVDQEIGHGVSGALQFDGGVDTRGLGHATVWVETVGQAEALRQRRARSIRNLGRASARLQQGLAAGTGAADWSQVTAAAKATSLATSGAEAARSALSGEDRSLLRSEGRRYRPDRSFLEGSDLDQALTQREVDTGEKMLGEDLAGQRRTSMARDAQSATPLPLSTLGNRALVDELGHLESQAAGRTDASRDIGSRDRWVHSDAARGVQDRIRDRDDADALPDAAAFRRLLEQTRQGRDGPQ